MSEPDRAQVPLDVHADRVRAWVAQEPITRAVIDAVWREAYGTDYVPAVRNFRAVVRLVVRHLWDGGDVPRPVWDDGGDDLQGATALGARLIDAVVFHVGRMASDGEPRWGVVSDPDDGMYGYAFVVREPARAVVGDLPRLFSHVLAGDAGLSDLEGFLWRAGEPAVRAADAESPPLQDAEFSVGRARRAARPRWGGLLGAGAKSWEIAVPPPRDPGTDLARDSVQRTVEELLPGVVESSYPAYTHLVWVDEAAESVWGEDRYAGFEGRLAAQPGIEKVWGEDREVVHVLAPTLSADEVLAAARRAGQPGQD